MPDADLEFVVVVLVLQVVFTIHNMNYGQKKITEAAYYCQKFTTVSPTYAFEVGGHPAIAGVFFNPSPLAYYTHVSSQICCRKRQPSALKWPCLIVLLCTHDTAIMPNMKRFATAVILTFTLNLSCTGEVLLAQRASWLDQSVCHVV